MPSLEDILVDEARRNSLAAECMSLIEREVDAKGGLGGVAVKTGFKAVRGIKPGFVEKVVYDLLPEFADAIEPLAAEARGQGKDVPTFFAANAPRVADAGDQQVLRHGPVQRAEHELRGAHHRLARVGAAHRHGDRLGRGASR